MKLTDLVRGYALVQLTQFNVLELYTGAIPTSAESAPTGTRLAVWPGTLTWDVINIGSVPVAPTQHLGQEDTIPEVSGTVGYARFRVVPKQFTSTGPIPPTLAQVNAYNSIYSAYLTVGLPGSGADMEMSTLALTAGLPISISELGTLTISGA